MNSLFIWLILIGCYFIVGALLFNIGYEELLKRKEKFFITEAQYNTIHVMFLFLWFPLVIFVLIDIAIKKGFNK